MYNFISLPDRCYNFISLPDRRNDEDGLTANQVFKRWRMHTQLYGEGKCIIELDGVEVDPVEEFGITSLPTVSLSVG